MKISGMVGRLNLRLTLSEHDVERRAAIRRNEHQLTAMAVPHDPTGERQSNPPTFLFRREPRVKDLVANLARDARPVVRDSNPDPTLGKWLRRDLDCSIATGEGIDRVLGQ